MTISRKLHPTIMIARECGLASPTRRDEVNGIVDDDRRCRQSGKPRMRRIRSIGGKWCEIVSDLYSDRMDFSWKINLQLDFFNLCLSFISLMIINKAKENFQSLLQFLFLSSLKVTYVV
ncbi:hypothetical protein ACFW04_007756 [Cataglyphis niger]